MAFTVVDSDARTRHYRVSRTADRGYALRLKGRDQLYPGLRELVAGACQVLHLSRPLPMSALPLSVLAQSAIGCSRFQLTEAKQAFLAGIVARMPPFGVQVAHS